MDNKEKTADKYRLVYDLHTHTTYSHGKGSVEDNVREAFNKKLEFIAISDHGPGHLFYGINRNELVNMRNDIERMNVKYPKLSVKMSVEANIINGGNGLDITLMNLMNLILSLQDIIMACLAVTVIRNWLWSKGFRKGEENSEKSY